MGGSLLVLLFILRQGDERLRVLRSIDIAVRQAESFAAMHNAIA